MSVRDNPLFASQWHFQLIGDIEIIWRDYTGVGVHVGVFDDGTESSHEDLDGNYDSSRHYSNLVNDDGQPIGPQDGHGTSVAGLIAAEDNTVGGVGVAFGALITGVNYLDRLQSVSTDVNLDALAHGGAFDIMNNSWGVTPVFGSPLTDPTRGSFASAGVFREIAEDGRGGLGTIILKAAGNDNRNPNLTPFGIFGNAQGDALNNLHEVITVAATGQDGFVTDYSNFGYNLTVSAPAAAITTDLTGSDGYNPGDYADNFGGTSAATPVVSGVVALMLDANDGLGWRDVQSILAISAAHTGSAFGGPAQGFEMDAWMTNDATNWNGGGMTYNISYGFGMVDAYAAVRMAEIWTRMHGAAQTTANMQTVTAVSTASQQIRDNSTIEVPIVVSQNIRIEHIYVTITGTHTYLGDLTVTLISPSGEEFVLIDQELDNENLSGSYTFGITAALGDTSAGTWRVRVRDSVSGDEGVLTRVELQFEGSAISTNTVHHITDDFNTYAGVESSRRDITDTDGGRDWLNMVAVQGNVVVQLASTGQIIVDSAVWAELTNGHEFENIATGDGNDSITGNTLNNDILSGRGNDVVDAGFGADTVEGGAGNDQLTGAQGADSLLGGDGNDTIFGNTGIDIMFGGNGADQISAGEGADTAHGGAGNDTIFGRSGADVIFGGDNNDSIIGSEGADLLNGGNGNDIIFGGSAFDTLFGNDGDDILFGNFGADQISGGNGRDEITGGSGDDTLRGGAGNDTIYGNQGRDSIEGGEGDDILRGGTLADRFVFSGNFGNDRIEDFEDNQDSLRISRDVTGGVILSGQQVIDQFATVVNGDVVFDFGNNMTITLEGVTSTAGLADNIFIT